MQKVFDEVNSLDKRCYDQFGLTEDLLMEHASASIKQFIQAKFSIKSEVLVVCGPGNNGADGIALARQMTGLCNVSLYIPFGTHSKMAKLQYKRAVLVNVNIIDDLASLAFSGPECIVVDCLFGSGLNKPLNSAATRIIDELNTINGYKIACDISSGIDMQGNVATVAFNADTTLTMGALKTAHFNDIAKDYSGNIRVCNLGIERSHYESKTDTFLLDAKDINLPIRCQHNAHKGTYGHVGVIVGDKTGAGLIAAQAAFAFGAGLVTAVSTCNISPPLHIMHNQTVPNNCNAMAIGMGLGNISSEDLSSFLQKPIAKVIDADLFYDTAILPSLTLTNIILTPHPKEFCALLKLTDIADIDTAQLQQNRFKYVRLFGDKYPKCVLLLKGANSLIMHNHTLFINNLGTSILSKGGSGDVLSGLIAALLAQGYQPLDAAISASLAHALAAKAYLKNNYSLTPTDLIECIKSLQVTANTDQLGDNSV